MMMMMVVLVMKLRSNNIEKPQPAESAVSNAPPPSVSHGGQEADLNVKL